MKLCDLNYEEALKRHPEEVKKIVAQLRKGKSKHRGEPPENLSWSYSIAVRIESACTSGLDLLTGKMHEEAVKWDALSLDEKVADTIRRTFTSLDASCGRWRGQELVPNPPEVQIQTRAGLLEQQHERERVDALSPEESEKELQEILKELGKSPGFVVLEVRR